MSNNEVSCFTKLRQMLILKWQRTSIKDEQEIIENDENNSKTQLLLNNNNGMKKECTHHSHTVIDNNTTKTKKKKVTKLNILYINDIDIMMDTTKNQSNSESKCNRIECNKSFQHQQQENSNKQNKAQEIESKENKSGTIAGGYKINNNIRSSKAGDKNDDVLLDEKSNEVDKTSKNVCVLILEKKINKINFKHDTCDMTSEKRLFSFLYLSFFFISTLEI